MILRAFNSKNISFDYLRYTMNLVKNNQTSFGWNVKTHYDITKLALRDSRLTEQELHKMGKASQMPDFSKEELGFCNNAHFYYPDSKTKSYGRNPEENNALSRFMKHMKLAEENSADGDKFLYFLANAFHYLQEVTLPLHTKKGNFAKKLLEAPYHVAFEKGKFFGATAQRAELVENYVPHIEVAASPKELFLNTADFSQQKDLKVTPFNILDWKEIQQTCFDKSVDVTTALWKMVNK